MYYKLLLINEGWVWSTNLTFRTFKSFGQPSFLDKVIASNDDFLEKNSFRHFFLIIICLINQSIVNLTFLYSSGLL